MRFSLLIFLIIVFSSELSGQSFGDNVTGRVSFTSSQNIYVKFKSTDVISAGDTLFIYSSGKLTPVLIVKNLSSGSCICNPIARINLLISQEILARKRVRIVKPETKAPDKNIKEIPAKVFNADTAKIKSYKGGTKQKINGSISAYSYSDFSNTGVKNSTQLRYTYQLNAQNIGNSKFSIDNYITFRHKLGDWASVKSDVFNALKIYTFDFRFDPTTKTRITLGRTLNYRISSIGAMDGLQVEQKIGKVTVGAVAGTRPDYINYGFDSKLIQYGGYLAFDTKSTETYSESSLAIMQQMNNAKTDRRFLYFQHSNSLLKNLNFFSTFEIDLYKTKNDLPQNTFNLTSLYLSLRYRISKNFSLTASYDQRKNVLFYETYKSLIDSVLENEKRQSYRLQANYRIGNNISFGLEGGWHNSRSDPHPSRNINGYLTYYQVPGLLVSATLTATYLESAFMNGKIFGADISKDLFQGKFQTSIGYRYIDYTLPESKLDVLQNVGQMGIFWLLSKKMSFSANYEGTFEKHDKYNRVYLQIRKRF